VSAYFGSTYLSESGVFNNENTKVKVQILRVAITKYTPNYNKLAEEMKR